MPRPLALALPAVAMVFTIALPCLAWVGFRDAAPDFEGFFCAVEATRAGLDPWASGSLTAGTSCTGGDPSPYLYPPPFLLLTAWLPWLAMPTASLVWNGLNLLCGLVAVVLLQRWARPSWPVMLALVALCTPIVENVRAGQVNLAILLLLVLVVTARSGTALATAGLVKMSPGALLLPLLVRRDRRTIMILGVAALLLSAATCLVVSPGEQLRFYTEVLPRFGSGFLDVDLPVHAMEHHSLSRLANDLFPSQIDGRLSAAGARVHKLLVGGLFLGLLYRDARGRRAGHTHPWLWGAWIVLLTLAPVFTWFTHLVFLLLPATALAAAAERSLLPRAWTVAFVLAIAVVALPFDWLRWPGFYLPEIDWLLRDVKLFACLTVGACCLELDARAAPPITD